jgi:two-component system, sensor histidine kinase YesM
MHKISFIIILGIINSFSLKAQEKDNSYDKNSMPNKSKSSKILNKQTNADAVSNALIINDLEKAAISFGKLGKEYFDTKDYVKAESYFKKAIENYAKLGKKEEENKLIRLLAQTQEKQNKTDDAIQSYGAVRAPSSERKDEISQNDMSRLRNVNKPSVQLEAANANALILQKKNDTIGQIATYQQLGEINSRMDLQPEAIQNYQNALTLSKNNPEATLEITKKLSDVYLKDDKYEEAIKLNKELLASPNLDIENKIEHLHNFASLYIDKKKYAEAIPLLIDCYNTAIQNNKTLEAKNCLTSLISTYNSLGDTKNALLYSNKFLSVLDSLVKKDSTLTDTKILEITEEKISLLEKENQLKSLIITKKNNFNYFLIASVLLLFGLLFGLWKALKSNQIKSKNLALQSLRRVMNPHFIFNSLNSVNQFIAQNKELEANKYLTSYSKLMRNVIENSNADFISIAKEVELLHEYLNLEKMRFEHIFSFEIKIAENIDKDHSFIPNMVLQPIVENAIWHGLRYIEQKGNLLITFKKEDQNIIVSIEDDGIGITESKKIKTSNQKNYKSTGQVNTKERLKLLSELHHISFSFEVKDKPTKGTIAIFTFPMHSKFSKNAIQ